jgi:hypothetical protein
MHLSPPTLLRKELDFSPPPKAGFFLPVCFDQADTRFALIFTTAILASPCTETWALCKAAASALAALA